MIVSAQATLPTLKAREIRPCEKMQLCPDQACVFVCLHEYLFWGDVYQKKG